MKAIKKGLICMSTVLAVSLVAPIEVFAEDVQAPLEITKYNGHSYAVIQKGMKWNEAEEYCESMGGHLATIADEEEQQFVASHIGNTETAKADGIYNYWLGGYMDGGAWKWVTSEPFNYTVWDKNQPDFTDEQWLEMYNTPNPGIGNSKAYSWNNIAEDGIGRFHTQENFFGLPHYGLVCEWDFDVETYNGHVYAFVKKGMTWGDAEKYCESMKGHLVTITSEEEQQFVADRIGNAETAKEDGIYNYWLGGYMDGDTWKWVTSEPFNFTVWDKNQPDFAHEQYLEMYNIPNPGVGGSKAYSWNNIANDGIGVFHTQEDFFGVPHYGLVCEWECAN